MYLKIYQTIKEIPPLALKLFISQKEDSLFLEKEWFELYEHYFLTPANSQFIVIFNESHQALALILLQKTHSAKRLTSISNFYSAYFAPILNKQLSEKDIIDVYRLFITDYLLINKMTSFELKPILLKNKENSLLIDTLKKYQFIIDDYDCFGNWTLDLNGLNYQQYFNKRPSRLKNTIKRKTKKLAKVADYTIKIYSTFEDIQAHIKEYEQIYQLSWKGDEASTEFIKQFITTYAKTGHTRLGIAYINGQAAASQFWLVHNKTALIYKLAYKPAYKEFSIGSILTCKIMEYVIEIDHVKKLDYLTGDDAYKQDWMDKRQQFSAFIAYNSRTILGLYYGLKFKSKIILKNTIKRLR